MTLNRNCETSPRKCVLASTTVMFSFSPAPTAARPELARRVLKKTLKEKGLTECANACYRTKVGCLRICCHGPTMLVYPEGTWYHGMTAERIPRFVQEHLAEGAPVVAWI